MCCHFEEAQDRTDVVVPLRSEDVSVARVDSNAGWFAVEAVNGKGHSLNLG